jgi:hypothetical protein
MERMKAERQEFPDMPGEQNTSIGTGGNYLDSYDKSG